MANLKKSEIQFLIQLNEKLQSSESFTEDYMKLQKIIDRQLEIDSARNERSKKFIAERRKTDPTYGRGKTELEKYKCFQREAEAKASELIDNWFK